MIQDFIRRYKCIRTERFLRQTIQNNYAFVGMGEHSLINLYPILFYLGIPLKRICITSERKSRMIEQKYSSIKATTSLDEILNDDTIKGVFVSTSPATHYSIASKVLISGKSLFVEKPPCQTLGEFDSLIKLQQLHGSPVAMIGLQKRYAPAVQILQKRLRKERLVSYDLHYLTGKYPEGDSLLDLYIHPLDLVVFLFGNPKIIAFEQIAKGSYILMLRHPHITGTLELSTAYSWASAEESLKVCTDSGIYRLSQMDSLTFRPKKDAVLGVPIEKLRPNVMPVEYLYDRNSFNPTLINNQVYSQGFFNEIMTFVNAVEENKHAMPLIANTIRDTYALLEELLKK